MKNKIFVIGFVCVALPNYADASVTCNAKTQKCCAGSWEMYNDVTGTSQCSTCCVGLLETCPSVCPGTGGGTGGDGTDCTPQDWHKIADCYQSKVECFVSLTSGVKESVSYRCDSNCYGTSTDGKTGCSPCPGSNAGGLGNGESRGTSPVGTTAITGCYIPEGIEICDDTGCFDLVGGNCYYKQ